MSSNCRIPGLHSSGHRVGGALRSHAALDECRRWEGYWVPTEDTYTFQYCLATLYAVLGCALAIDPKSFDAPAGRLR